MMHGYCPQASVPPGCKKSGNIQSNQSQANGRTSGGFNRPPQRHRVSGLRCLRTHFGVGLTSTVCGRHLASGPKISFTLFWARHPARYGVMAPIAQSVKTLLEGPLQAAETLVWMTWLDKPVSQLIQLAMKAIYTTEIFDGWFESLKDRQAARRIQARIDRAEDGNFGDHKSVGEGVSEMRIHHGPGFRVYFTLRGLEIVILLAGGDKSSQAKDIQTAQALARQMKE
jgi:putative addiction module killer protein